VDDSLEKSEAVVVLFRCLGAKNLGAVGFHQELSARAFLITHVNVK
jgi:hypothetical protein